MVSRFLVALDVGEMAANTLPLPETEEETHFVEVGEGVKLYVKTATRSGDEGAPWLIFVNSLMTNSTMWDATLPRLSKKYNLLSFDQRGHGRVSIISSCMSLRCTDGATIVICSVSPRDIISTGRRHCQNHLRALHHSSDPRSRRSLARRCHDARFRSRSLDTRQEIRRLRYPGRLSSRQFESLGRQDRARSRKGNVSTR